MRGATKGHVGHHKAKIVQHAAKVLARDAARVRTVNVLTRPADGIAVLCSHGSHLILNFVCLG